MTLLAECSNCASWQNAPDTGHRTTAIGGFCGRGLVPDAGKPLCGSYVASDAFRRRIISQMLKDEGPMALPVKLVGGRKSARAANEKLARRRAKQG